MRPGDFGQLIGTAVVQTSERELPAIQQLIGRDPTATRANLPLAMAWVCHVKLEELLGLGDRPEVIQMMLAVVMLDVMQVTGWAYPVMRSVLENRLEEYAIASSAEEGHQVLNIAKYFMGCCDELREEVRYGEMIPDLNELQSYGLEVNPDFILWMEQARGNRHWPTYSLNRLILTKVVASILSLGASVEVAVAKYWQPLTHAAERGGQMITFKCKACGVSLRVTDDKADKSGKCPRCGASFVVPTSSTALTVASIAGPSGACFVPISSPPWALEMADELKRDFDRLSELGVNLDQAAAVAKPAGVGAGIYVAFRVHPLLGAAIAGMALLAKVGTDAWKNAKIEDVRQKWLRTLTGMNEEQLMLFAMAIRTRYPLLLPAADLFLPPGGG